MFFMIAFVIVVLPFALWLLEFYWSVLTTRHLPPGPFPLPVIGNVHLFSSNEHVSLENLATKYGDLITVYLGTDRTVVARTPELAREILVQQSLAFAGRPRFVQLSEELMNSYGKNIMFHQEMCPLLKRKRKLFHFAVKSFGSGLLVLEERVCDVVTDLIGRLGEHRGTVRDIHEDVHLCIANVVCSMTFGSKYEQGDKEFDMVVKAFDSIQRGMGPPHLVDIIPLLRKLPITYVLEMKKAVALVHSVVMGKWLEHQAGLDDGDARDLTDALLKQRQSGADDYANNDDELPERDLQMVIFDIFLAGLETSAASILWGVCFLARHPELQDAIHDEMRRCLEPDTLPTFHDRRRLPFLQATVSEIYRHSSIVPLLPHSALKDVSLGGYVIPAGTTVFVNAWAIHHDPRMWGDPHTFRPARFLDQNGNYSPPDPFTFLPFGAGRRGCAGEVLGKMMVFITLARMLYAYRFTMVSDQNVGTDPKPQFLRKPRSFEVLIVKNDWN